MTENKEGVYITRKKDGSPSYRSSVTFHRRHISLGSYPDADSAHKAYLEANRILHLKDPLLTLCDYDDSSGLPFEKWVVLLNFRDNGLYFSTPIYIRIRHFLYYYSRELVLKFDSDDLFYYASHKIMKRGNHYFVADFGMQVNILNRYGIKNYAVIGRDYDFANGDSTDFRRENLIIRNRYHGVRPVTRNGRTRYRAVLHVRSNYLIGVYDTPEEAAIAYNKAVDIVRKNGSVKKYPVNYLENITAGEYAALYTRLPVSEKIMKL